MQLGYLGPEGSYSYEAAKAYSPDAKLRAMSSFHEIIAKVEAGSIDEGILPVENSTEGVVTPVIDSLAKTNTSVIKGEFILPIIHNLWSKAEKVEEIYTVLSHPQAIEQCREYFKENLPHVELLPCESSSAACMIANEKGGKFGAIANGWIGMNYGLKIICREIQDNSFNQTRFWIIGRKRYQFTGRDKTSIAFSFHDDRPGNLFAVLKEFAQAEVNLTMIQSRPAKAELGKYIFFIDFIGHEEEERIKKVLDDVKKITRVCKVMGSYPRAL